ncbi:hypothetical protein [Alistipes sp.]|uniref:hypothetical protein n=1 Tax=Alistipes sp. TaxID=1872444 RepID=UPI003AF043AE
MMKMQNSKTETAISLLLISLLATGLSCTHRAPASAETAGVWADTDCEVLRTERFALVFERSDSVIAASLIRTEGNHPFLLGRAVFSADDSTVVERYILRNDTLRADPGTVLSDGRLRIAGRSGERLLEKIERVRITEPYQMLHASPLERGTCIQQWNLGTRLEADAHDIRFEAGTNRHNYAFYIQPDFIYCRAARLRFNDRGGLFAQHIRLMSNSWEQTACMAGDNRAASAAPLAIDDAKFLPDRCVFDREGIYWSFLRFEGDTAVVNGCGELYRYARPAADGEALSEWIAFEKY